MKLLLKGQGTTERIEIEKLPAWILVDQYGWLEIHYDEESANKTKIGMLEGGTDCTIYVLDYPD